jgi:hypothetical protein
MNVCMYVYTCICDHGDGILRKARQYRHEQLPTNQNGTEHPEERKDVRKEGRGNARVKRKKARERDTRERERERGTIHLEDKTRQDKTRQDKTRQDKTRQGKARQGR